MVNKLHFLAMDYGASTGRGIVGSFDGSRVTLDEVHRFQNYFVDINGLDYWDVMRLYHELLGAVQTAVTSRGYRLQSVGVDTWGTDYGLLDRNGQLIGNCRCMRNSDGSVVDACSRKISLHELFDRTGIQMIYGNTVFQLYERLLRGDPALEQADRLLMMPDMLAYFLTGKAFGEYTMASTSMLYSHKNGSWDLDIPQRLGLPTHIFPQIRMPAGERIPLRRTLLAELGQDQLEYIPVGTHDTASAVAAAPLEPDTAFCSSGTWSIFGAECDAPVLSEDAYRSNFSNEGTINGKVRLLKNIMGMWVMQRCNAEWERQGKHLTWDEIVAQAELAPAFRSFIDLEQPMFYQAGNMIDRVRGYCENSGQPIPESVGELARCVYESLAMRYRYTMEQLERVTGRRFKALHIVGGGCQNNLLNRFAANALQRPVYAGPVESASIGNILTQAMACGEIANQNEMRQVVRNSQQIVCFEPEAFDAWKGAYAKYCKVVDNNPRNL